METGKQKAIRVFISYSRDSKEHNQWCKSLADQLNKDGCEAFIDEYVENPAQGWPGWMLSNIEEADYVVVIFTEEYAKKSRERNMLPRGAGVAFESVIIQNLFYADGTRGDKFVPVCAKRDDVKHIVPWLTHLTYYGCWDEDGYSRLHQRLTGQSNRTKPDTGPLRKWSEQVETTTTQGSSSLPVSGSGETDAVKELRSFIETAQQRPLVFLLVGRAGVGKSSTVNALLGKEVSKPSRFTPGTAKVVPFQGLVNGVPYLVIDTPGFAAVGGDDSKYAREIKAMVDSGRIDSVWYVSTLDEPRLRKDEIESLGILMRELGTTLWERSVIVLTCSDKLDPEEFAEALKIRGDGIRSAMEQSGLPRLVAQDIPTIPISNKCPKNPDGKPWLGELFVTVLERLPKEAAASYLVSLAARMRAKHKKPLKLHIKKKVRPVVKAESISDQSRVAIPIDLNAQQEARTKKVARSVAPSLAITGGIIGAGLGGPVGAMIGAGAGWLVGLLIG